MTDPMGAPSGAGDTGQSAGATNQGEGTAAATGGQSAPGATGTTPTDGGQSTVTREEFDRLRNQLQAADQKRTQAEQQLAQLRDKDMPALQKAERDLQAANQTINEQNSTISQMRVQLAFYSDNTHDWHNNGAALQMLDLSKITVDSEGKVTGMKDALEALAKAHPYMLKPKEAGEGNGTPPAPPAPGTPPANGGIGQQQGGKQTAQQVAQRFPAMRQRI